MLGRYQPPPARTSQSSYLFTTAPLDGAASERESRKLACGTHNALHHHRSYWGPTPPRSSPNDGCRRSFSRVAALPCFHRSVGLHSVRGVGRRATQPSSPIRERYIGSSI